MKKMLLVLFVACSMFLQAQTFMVNDFESSALGSDGGGCRVAWSGSIAVVANPVVNAVNPSANALKLTNTGWPPVEFPVTLPAGKTWADYDGVRVKFCPLAGATLDYANIEIGLNSNNWTHNKVGSGNAWSTAVINTWYSCDFAFDVALKKGDLDSIASPSFLSIKYNKESGYDVLIDDVQLIEHQDPAREVTLNFEDQVLGTSSNMGVWYATGTSFAMGVVANPVTTGINTSAKAMQVIYPTGGGAIDVNILPANGDWHNYDYVSFDVLATAWDVTNPWTAVFVGGGPDAWTGGSQQWSDTIGVHNLNQWYHVIVPIGSVKNSTQPYLNIQANGGVTYLFDNISLKRNGAQGLNTPKESTLKVARLLNGQYQVSIGSVSAYKLLNVEGRVMRTGTFTAGINLLSVADMAKGIYLLQTTSNSEKNVVKIIR